MAKVRMHPDQVDTSPGLLRRLLRAQFPTWADASIVQVDSFGTDHDIYRVGNDLVARLPKVSWAAGQPAKEARWLPVLAPHLPLRVPTPVALGRPGAGYPFEWAVHRWLPGESGSRGLADLQRAAVDLAGFIVALRRVDTAGAPARPFRGRGAPLAEGDAQVRRSIETLGPSIDGRRALQLWAETVAAPAWAGEEVWVHGDLLPGNLLVREGRLQAVIDFGGLNVGDAACDLQPAWNIFAGASRDTFRAALGGVDEASWLRGKGWVLLQTVSALAYYRRTNPGMVAQASHALAEVLADRRP